MQIHQFILGSGQWRDAQQSGSFLGGVYHFLLNSHVFLIENDGLVFGESQRGLSHERHFLVVSCICGRQGRFDL